MIEVFIFLKMNTSTSSDIRTTRYTNKANVETTHYFNSFETNIQNIEAIQAQLFLKENINYHNNDIDVINTSLYKLSTNVNLKENIIDHNNDISKIQSLINTKKSIIDHVADITNLQTQINAIVPGTPYEGLYTLSFDDSNVILTYNYNLGKLKFLG